MKNVLLLILLFLSGTTGSGTTWIITNSATFTFTPATITITQGDSVSFQLEAIHNAVEVSLDTWNTNGITPLPGFSTPFGGGLVLPVQLTVGTHYYVCQNHVSLHGMKGTIIVQSVTGIDKNSLIANINIFPNPSGGKLRLEYNGLPLEKNCSLEIYDVKGEKIYQTLLTNPKSDIDVGNRSKGIYFIRINDGLTVITKRIVIE